MGELTGSQHNGISTAGPAVSNDVLTLEADVLVIGGGPAGTWAAWTAASRGARVVLADKGYCGTSGATAPSGVGVWYVPPDPDAREDARSSREAMGGHLADRAWMDRVLDQAAVGWGEGRSPGARQDQSFRLLAPERRPAAAAR